MYAPARVRWFCCQAGVAAGLLLLTGCANPGPPKPPSLHLAKPATGLGAERVGDRVVLHWMVAGGTTDGGGLKLPLTAVICRSEAAAKPTQPECAEVRRLPDRPGKTEADDPLPLSLTTGKARLLSYRIELLNADGRSAGLSGPVYTAAGAAPSATGALSVQPIRNGTVLAWSADRTGIVEVTRSPLTRLAAAAGTGKEKKAGKPFTSRSSNDEDVILTPGISDDPGGMVDRGIHDGDTVVYVADRVRRVDLEVPASAAAGRNGRPTETKASTQTFELRSEASAPVTFTFHDVLPPSAPTGLNSVAGGGFGQAVSIDLSWEANPEADVAGYNIYRKEATGTMPEKKLNPQMVPAPAYRDVSAVPGTRYLYRVTAVDKRGQESAGSEAAAARLNP